MRMDTKKEINGENEIVFSLDVIGRNEQKDGEEKEEKENEGKIKREVNSDKRSDGSGNEEENDNLDVMDLIRLLRETVLSDEIISRSPIRSQDCHRGNPAKPYAFPFNTSRTDGGVTRVVESEQTIPYPYRRLNATLQPPTAEGQVGDVNLYDINVWLNLCKKDPKLLSDFVKNCQTEMSKREIPHFYDYRSSRNPCSNFSSQFASPAQSPSEQSLTSPESVTCEEYSLYHSRSPNIPSLDRFSIEPVEEERKKAVDRSDARYSDAVANAAPESSFSVETCSNIGTVMLNLAQDPYENTIDLNQFATVCDTHAEAASTSGSISNFPFASATSERDALNEKLDPKTKESAWARISQLDIDLLGKGDKEGDTQLMILLVSKKVTREYVYVIVERLLKENAAYLACRNELNQDALYLASFKVVWEPLIASYIAEALVRGKQDVNMKYDGGNTLLHCMAKKGDAHAKLLERLLKLKHDNWTSAFDVNKKNNRGYTPLHVACEAHKNGIVHTYQVVKILVENGADCIAKEYKDENTPLHILINESCDVDLIRTLLETEYKWGRREGLSSTVVANRQGNTALHLSCGRNTLNLHHQKEVIRLLLAHGAMIQLKNMNGFVPSVLVDGSRKQEIKTILHGHRQRQM